MRYPKRRGRPAVPGRVRLATAAMLLMVTTVAACGGGQDDDATTGAPKAPAAVPELSTDPLTLSFVWFEWPPAKALEAFANEEYKKVRPNTTIKVNTVPNANWHDAMFTQFAARKTDFDIAILDSQHIGEAVTNGNILDLTDFVKNNIEVDAYDPYLLAAYGQFPQAETGQRDENASLYGLPLLGDTWTMIYRKDLIGDPPQTWDDMIAAAAKCQAENPGVSGLAFHQANGSDAAAVTYNTVNGVYGGNLWDAKTKKIEGVLNDAAGQEAMDVLVTKMKPLTAKGSGNWFIDEVNAAVAQGKACIAFNWIAASGGLLDPKQSALGKTREQILGKLGFATLPRQKTDLVPLGGMGMHVSAYSPAAQQAEALNFMKWFEQADIQKKWAAAGGVPSRTDAIQSPEFLNAGPFNKVYADSVPRMRDMWNVPEYARLVDIENTNVNAALNGAKEPKQALDDIAKEQQSVLDSSGRKGGGGL
ncbi:ABC transporter substrate-binding protein [Paractinoplanes abujensis]|uniref:Multiple sugar transport system substrate-binding protein n=1 Tax=Paractinoplanes abujensis TaxID=882441 RepID=A0A7W7G3Y7_9ACTN|nr:extracellular solute-binding protein [Actinoplanes abujensis]MBB4693251.1 multiple sugar transport system substrate-binding protein [Actinoplanes abujensis]GID24450.1 ABC transporter substrate-binding protein [Actinoplanes abujensis]